MIRKNVVGLNKGGEFRFFNWFFFYICLSVRNLLFVGYNKCVMFLIKFKVFFIVSFMYYRINVE